MSHHFEYMHHLIITEESRVGNFEIPPGVYGKLEILGSTPLVAGMIDSENPSQDFNFSLPCYVQGRKVGECSFKIADMDSSKFMLKTLHFTENASITLAVCWVTPYHKKLGEPDIINFPKVWAIGHRGSGSNRVVKKYLENSMGGFMAAAQAGADFVEFDIQLTKDGVPVIYHDLAGVIREDPIPGLGSPQQVMPDGRNRYTIQQFTEDQFRKSGLLTDWKTERSTFADLLTKLPSSLGFDIEMKYPSPLKKNVTIPFADMNEYVDTVLDVMDEHGHGRKMFFSSFNPFICMMLKLKQKKWPVMQLFEMKKSYGGVDGLRKRIMTTAALHTHIGTEGFVLHAEDLVNIPNIVKALLDKDFLLNTFGDINNTEDGIKRQLDMGIRGICTDNMKLCRRVLDQSLSA